MNRQYFISLLTLLFLVASSCEEDKKDLQSDEPSNLVLEITIAEDDSGDIVISANAENTEEYHFFLGDGTEDPEVNTDGILNYTYASSGVFEVEARAYGSSGRFIKKNRQISITLAGPIVQPDDGYSTPLAYESMNLVWQDEFNGSALNTSDWTYEIGTGSSGWGNNELEYYREENTTVSNGYLTIEAREESFGGSNYTSSRLVTKDKQTFIYGRVDIRAKLPQGQGIWPALWTLGNNIGSVGWPACGEIDIMEMIGGQGRDGDSHGTIHWENNGYANYGGDFSLSSGIFNDQFHVFSVIWDDTYIRWMVDDVEFHVVDITPPLLSEFHAEHFFIFNLAVGGNWPGSPDASTVFPQQMVVDYIRVFQDK